MKTLLKRLGHALLGEYGIYQVWASASPPALAAPPGVRLGPVDAALLQAAPEPEFRNCTWYQGEEARAFGVFEGGRLLAVAWLWWGQRYAARHSWPLPAGTAKLVHIVAAPAARGRGLAPLLIAHAEQRMREDGFTRLFARIWHSNEPSRRAFRRAGWQPVGWYLEANPLRRAQPWRLAFRTVGRPG